MASLMTIPPELREQIYALILHPDANRHYHEDEYTSYSYQDAVQLFLVNRQIYHESRKIFQELNTFVRVETPWPEAQFHVAREGHVPLIAPGGRAARFEGHSMTVGIDAPEVPVSQEAAIDQAYANEEIQMEPGDEQPFLILLEDLDKFCTMWFYSSLSHEALNPQLRLDLTLRDPRPHQEKHLQKSLQRRLLLPFAQVKNLRSMVVTGDPKPDASVEAELRELQKEPHKRPEQCLREAIQFKAEGNAQLTAGHPREALEIYHQAWLAMHVVIKGRRRHIHADHFFAREMREEPFTGKNGQSERLILRVQLVANTCLAYIKLEQWEDCAFWGMRSIGMIREAMGADDRYDIPPEDEAVLGFPAANQMGKIYYRTALAKKAMEDKTSARKLLRVAAIYLPRDENVKQELAACALRLG
ncbi:hypothetical protein D0863_10739 [Hortaea werneckii]|uniref:Uncharacterized protein n=1 Tax=Hortaea werneckii TaxID=91943 RepID=A0A3M7DG00_HORWE|nr:hypothetical protein D0863_10739 [Hortaea werneckii]